ncbi:MAG: hypothetical protein EO766_12240 [Hydrotalea sp. AMD]|uniref:hypothetical protein n=1 Tax=Hydrotalea sp. AMD TaxID=2501297 RepID=UPI0010275514|nr:hypothetical protein [Hydrotalea sp. AMD]RWZ87287.1 MAG: hypothetical protein EO766_12240 [Hydrotalea sp. AMD]
MARVDGKHVKIGHIVGFKSDVEQCGKITKIEGQRLTLEALDSDHGFHGDYIGGNQYHCVLASDCWLED